VLVAIEEVRVVDGLPGRPARYTLVQLPGAAPLTETPLPLIGAAPRRPKPRVSPATTPSLFDLTITREETAIIGSQGSQGSQVHKGITWITRITGWLQSAITRITGITGFGRVPPITCRPSTCDPCDPVVAIDTRARATYNNLKTTTTTTAPCKWLGTVHAWCDGRMHVPMDFHQEERRKLARRPGETDADLDAQLFARYAETLAGIPADEKILDKNEFVFWNRVLRRATSPARASPHVRMAPTRVEPPDDGPAAGPPYDAVWRQILARIETKIPQHTFDRWFLPLVMVQDTGSLIEVTKQGPDSGLFADWIQKHYAAVVQEAVDEVRPGARVEVFDIIAAQDVADRKFG
jgi:DnaA N-terminal domain